MALKDSVLQRAALGIVAVILLALLARMAEPMLSVLLWSMILTAMLRPAFRAIEARAGGRRRPRALAALALALLGTALLVLPLALLALLLSRQLAEATAWARTFLEQHPETLRIAPGQPIGDFLASLGLGGPPLQGIDLGEGLRGFLGASQGALVEALGRAAGGLAEFAVSLTFIVFTVYYFLLDGKLLLAALGRAVPVRREHLTRMAREFALGAKALVRGYLLVALYQGIVGFCIYSAFGVPGALVLAAATAFGSFVPLFGAGLVWIPVAAYVALNSGVLVGLLALAACAFLISVVDNFLRPLLLKGRLRAHPLFIFFSIIGGLSAFGFNGLVLGPLLLVLFATASGIYLRAERRLLPRSLPGGEGGER